MVGHWWGKYACNSRVFSKPPMSYACCELALFSFGWSLSATPPKTRLAGIAPEFVIGPMMAR